MKVPGYGLKGYCKTAWRKTNRSGVGRCGTVLYTEDLRLCPWHRYLKESDVTKMIWESESCCQPEYSSELDKPKRFRSIKWDCVELKLQLQHLHFQGRESAYEINYSCNCWEKLLYVLGSDGALLILKADWSFPCLPWRWVGKLEYAAQRHWCGCHVSGAIASLLSMEQSLYITQCFAFFIKVTASITYV